MSLGKLCNKEGLSVLQAAPFSEIARTVAFPAAPRPTVDVWEFTPPAILSASGGWRGGGLKEIEGGTVDRRVGDANGRTRREMNVRVQHFVSDQFLVSIRDDVLGFPRKWPVGPP